MIENLGSTVYFFGFGVPHRCTSTRPLVVVDSRVDCRRSYRSVHSFGEPVGRVNVETFYRWDRLQTDVDILSRVRS